MLNAFRRDVQELKRSRGGVVQRPERIAIAFSGNDGFTSDSSFAEAFDLVFHQSDER
jgi:hypothetical protein